MSSDQERLVRMETKLDDLHEYFFRWTDRHDTLHGRFGVGLFLVLIGAVAGIIL